MTPPLTFLLVFTAVVAAQLGFTIPALVFLGLAWLSPLVLANAVGSTPE